MRDLKFYAQAIKHGSTNPSTWITSAQDVLQAERAAQDAQDATRDDRENTLAVVETFTYGLLVLAAALLIVLLLTPSY